MKDYSVVEDTADAHLDCMQPEISRTHLKGIFFILIDPAMCKEMYFRFLFTEEYIYVEEGLFCIPPTSIFFSWKQTYVC